jgi:hypothetical protein
MTPDYPHHSSDAFMTNATPVQSFVDPPHEVTDEERNRPRHGRPTRPGVAEPPTKPDTDAVPPAS